MYYLVEINTPKEGEISQGIFPIAQNTGEDDGDYFERAKSQWHNSCASAGANIGLATWARCLMNENMMKLKEDTGSHYVPQPENNNSNEEG